MKGNAATYALALGVVMGSASTSLQAQTYPITESQRSTAKQTAAQGIPISELVPNAPERYTVKSGDTLWHIAGMYLLKPWQWPQLWGMNMQAIANPHLIYPGQVLHLEKNGNFARLSTSADAGSTVKLSPRVREGGLTDLAIPTLQLSSIQAFLAEPLVIDSNTLEQAPRIIASVDERVLLSQGDKVYARGPEAAPLVKDSGTPIKYRLFRQATPIKDPITGALLGYEAQYVGQADLLRGETPFVAPKPLRSEPERIRPATEAAPYIPSTSSNAAEIAQTHLPATLTLQQIKEEVRAGDRLLPEPERQLLSFVPHAPTESIEAHVASIYGNNTHRYGTERQVVAINKGSQDGVAPGMVLSVISKGQKLVDKTDDRRPTIQLPDEENGLAIVFRSFDRVSYALILDTQRGVQVGDLLTSPQ